MAATYEELRQRHVAEFNARVPEQLQRVEWSPEQIRAERERRLRVLVRTAQERSPWHRERLAGVDADSLRDEDLERLPVMTKDDLMANWDAIVTERRLTLAAVEEHLDSLTTDAYLLDQYHAVASSGSSGRRGVFLFDWDGWATMAASGLRYGFRWSLAHPDPRPLVWSSVTADRATHISSAGLQTFSNPAMRIERFPATLEFSKIVAGLNEVQPTILGGYPSLLNLLAAEARAGGLRIRPHRIQSVSEPLLPETRRAIESAWGVPIFNIYGSSEGLIGSGCGHSDGCHLADEIQYLEPVDASGRRVPVGTRSAKVYFTNLYNLALPLIRYEITDQVVYLEAECPCGSAHRRIGDIEGRLDDVFEYAGGVQVHPHVFRSPLSHQPSVLEYQVRQTERGADISVRLAGEAPIEDLSQELDAALRKVGLADPELSITAVDSIDRGATGKLKRFVPTRSPMTVG